MDLIDSSSLLVDDTVYSQDSYQTLIGAIAAAKVVLKDESASEDALRIALQHLCNAVDSMEIADEVPSRKRTLFFKKKKEQVKERPKKNVPAINRALPYAICGGVIAASTLALVGGIIRPFDHDGPKKGR